jgi:alkylation response protein AidB-like acyl-CoA dehydrogenase
MDLTFSAEDEQFRLEVRSWLEDALTAPHFAPIRGRGGLGDMDAFVEERKAWERHLATGRWTCVGWPEAFGGRGLSLHQEVIYNEEYVRARAPGRANHCGEHLLGPTLIHFGTKAQQERFLPRIVDGTEVWCQGYSEPGAGSDLAGLRTRAEPAELPGQFRVTGQKVWTSLAPYSDWCFVLARTNPDAPRHRGISCLLVKMDQPGITVRPIRQMTGSAEFAEVFFDGAVAEHVVGPLHGGWKVAMATLAFERGASTLGQQLAFKAELERIIDVAKQTGAARDPILRDRIAELWMRLEVMRLNALRTLSVHDGGELPRAAMVQKLYWATWHRDLGELAMDVLGSACAETDPTYEDLHRLFLWSRSDTIYAGTNQIQRNIIAQRALGLPRA